MEGNELNMAFPFVILIIQDYIQRNKLYILQYLEHVQGIGNKN